MVGSGNMWVRLRRAASSQSGAIDLASIMVGIVVIGLIGGVIGATIFAVIPWAQDQAAKASLKSVAVAEQAYAGFVVSAQSGTGSIANSSDRSLVRPSEVDGVYVDYDTLVSEGYVQYSDAICAVPNDSASNWNAAIISGSGRSFYLTDEMADPEQVTDGQETCFGVWSEADGTYTVPAVSTNMTLNCDVTTNVSLPFRGANGTYTWSDGETGTLTSSGGDWFNNVPVKTLTAGTTYTFQIDGTFASFTRVDTASQACIVSLDQWDSNSGVTSLSGAFQNATKLTYVAPIPDTVTDTSYMFRQATNFNQDISAWNVSNVTNMQGMFLQASAFNQPLNNWDVGNVTNMQDMFYWTNSFNQPLNNWDVSNVTNMRQMFRLNPSFNQPLNNWDVSNVTDMSSMFN